MVSDEQRKAFREKQAHLTQAFEELLSNLSFTMSSEERELVEHYVEHREFGLAFDRLCDSVLTGKTLTNEDRSAIRQVGLKMGPFKSDSVRLHPWLTGYEGD